MKFSSPVRAPEGLNSYAKVNRIRPVHLIINLVEALLSLLGVIVLILLIRYGSFEKAGAAIDHTIGCVHDGAVKLLHHDSAAAKT